MEYHDRGHTTDIWGLLSTDPNNLREGECTALYTRSVSLGPTLVTQT